MHRQQVVEDTSLLVGNQCDDKGYVSTHYVLDTTQMFICHLYVAQKSTLKYVFVCLFSIHGGKRWRSF